MSQVATLLVGGEHGGEVGIGALLGAPGMLSTRGFFITGASGRPEGAPL